MLHFDFETLGLPVPGMPSNHPGHPKPVSLSAILDDENGVMRRTMSAIIKPDGWTIDERLTDEKGKPTAFSIHRITNKTALRYGLPLKEVIGQFADMMLCTATLSAFSAHFDTKLIKISCALLGEVGETIRAIMETKESVCTMENAANNLIGKRRISLKNAYFEMFHQETQTGAHGSLEDTTASRRIYYELLRRGHICEVKSLAAKEYDTPPPGADDEAAATPPAARKRAAAIGG